ncbi:glycoside hydrolase family 88/105 protein [Thalassotalea sp. PLHSN55]|uniref:glycoside hydrolase family 88/105 protein n=1 Tax=Thalassotalea sp. PLHSN55 TaxID=3435888 RepID=UPI003F842082
MIKKIILPLFISALFAGALFPKVVSAQNQLAPDSQVPATDINYPDAKQTMQYMEQVANWQLPRLFKADYATRGRKPSENPKQWIQGAFYVGLAAIAERSNNPTYAKWIGMIGQQEKWQLANRLFHADDHIIGQTYLWYYQNHQNNEQLLAHTRSQFDKILAADPQVDLAFIGKKTNLNKSDCQQRWCWADALFMSPPTWFALANATGEKKYADYAHKEFKATLDYLYDTKTHLVFRDSRYFDLKGEFGEQIFWSRGMGWVIAGLANSIKLLDKNDPNRAYYTKHFIEMAYAIKKLQKQDGTWSSSLLAHEKMTNKEASGTAFFTYAFAWGIKNGLLSAQDFWPSTEKAWSALTSFIHPDGKLGHVQQIGDKPGESAYDSTQIYGAGAFLLAGAMIYDLASEK